MWKVGLTLVLVIFGIFKFFYVAEYKSSKLSTDHFWGPEVLRKVNERIRPFKINVPQEIMDDLKLRLDQTHPFRKPLEGAAWTYGANSDYIQTVIEYWKTEYNWTKRQAALNRYPQFKTNIQGLDIHFYHVKPTIPKNRPIKILPVLLIHGWPGSVVEFQKIIPLFTIPRSNRDFVFELIIPSLPGYGFSDAAIRPGLGNAQITVIFKILMSRLGFETFYAQGGDWGSVIATNMGILYPKTVLGIHLNFCVIATKAAAFWTFFGDYAPVTVVSDEHWSKMYPLSNYWPRLVEESGYLHLQATKPDTIGAALSDSPAGLAAYILEKFSTWTNPDYRFSQDGNLLKKFTMDELLDNIMVYWVENTITSSMRLYAESLNTAHYNLEIDVHPVHTPTACAIFPHEIIYQSQPILELKYKNLIQMNHFPRGGHFAAFEEPLLLADDFWTFVTSVQAKINARKPKKPKRVLEF